LICLNASVVPATHHGAMWEPISTAPYDCDLELVVIDRDGPHALVFACRRTSSGWTNSETKTRVDVHPTH